MLNKTRIGIGILIILIGMTVIIGACSDQNAAKQSNKLESSLFDQEQDSLSKLNVYPASVASTAIPETETIVGYADEMVVEQDKNKLEEERKITAIALKPAPLKEKKDHIADRGLLANDYVLSKEIEQKKILKKEIADEDKDIMPLVSDMPFAPGRAKSVLAEKAGLEQLLVKKQRIAKNNIALSIPYRNMQTLQQIRNQTEGLSFKPATGYWKNTYLPGAPFLRRLGNEVKQQHVAQTMAKSYWQPFDAPENTAMAVYLHTDKAYMQGDKERLLLQVGLKASEQYTAHRLPMNIGIIIDLHTQLEIAYFNKIKAVLFALVKHQQTGDRFSVTVLGRQGGVVIASKDFRYGAVKVYLDTLQKQLSFHTRHPPSMDLYQVLSLAYQEVQQQDNPDAPLGASSVLLLTNAKGFSAQKKITDLIHRYALQGISFSSMILLNSSNDHRQLSPQIIDNWVLIGQGNRRIITDIEAITEVLKKELYSVSRVVARAIRLRIRLAAGVQLIDILGSKPLSIVQSQRVREMEQSIDKRLASNLGLRMDRGKDEEGIQIVIPAYYAGDAHVFLLDIVAHHPGLIADVKIKYKDLLHLRNTENQASISLSRQYAPLGPLEYNVQKNYLGYQLAYFSQQSGTLLKQGALQQAVKLLKNFVSILQTIQKQSIWKNDQEVNDDIRLLQHYLHLLQQQKISVDNKMRQYLSNALTYLAYSKLLSTPLMIEN